MSQKEQYYDYQQAFNGGEISPEVANRTDLDKYKSALVKAQNCYIRPYGAVYKRPGTLFINETKYANKETIITEFSSINGGYLLELGDKYIRVYKGDTFLGVEIETPYMAEDLAHLRFAQSADSMYIASGKYPVKILQRYGDNNWKFFNFDMDSPYFDISNTIEVGTDDNSYINVIYDKPGIYKFKCLVDGEYTIEIASGGGAGVYCRCYWYEDYKYGCKHGGRGEIKKLTLNMKQGDIHTIQIGYPIDNEQLIYAVDSDEMLTVTIDGVQTVVGMMEDCSFVQEGKQGASARFDDTVAIGGGGASVTLYAEVQWNEDDPDENEWYEEWIFSRNGTDGVEQGTGAQGGYYTVKKEGRYGSWEYTSIQPEAPYVKITKGTSKEIAKSSKDISGITTSALSGTTTIRSEKTIFNSKMVGACIKLWHSIASKTITVSKSGTTDAMMVGEGWKILTHGKWGGTVNLEKSDDCKTWITYRTYTSNYVSGNGDNNVAESGTYPERGYIRAVLNITGGSCTVDLTAMTYEHEGYAKIISVVSSTEVTANVIKEFGSLESTDTYALSCWCEAFGYPKTVGFFQDRLVLAGSSAYPYAVWMSRTGDYYNYSVEKAGGKVTDDSAIMLSIISRKDYSIEHIIPSSDLVIFTTGNEWLISGSQTVTPSAAIARVQSSRGSSEVEPITIGSRIIYVERRGKTVRDFAYSFDSDNYDGTDLTILAKHLTNKDSIVDGCYKQYPDSAMYFVTSGGQVNCLSYINDQKVYAWSTIRTTKGLFKAVASVTSSDTDTVYAVVRRIINGAQVQYIEKFAEYDSLSVEPMDHVMLDSAQVISFEEGTKSISGLGRFRGEKVMLLIDGRVHEDVQVSNEGVIEVEGIDPGKRWIVGLPYKMIIEQPNIELMTNAGTMQGKMKKVSEVILRLSNTMGGRIGVSNQFTDEIKYENSESTYLVLYTGDKKSSMPTKVSGGYENSGRVYIESSDPYPFYLSSVVRVVSFGG